MKVGDLVNPLYEESFSDRFGIIVNIVTDPQDGRNYLDVLWPSGLVRCPEYRCVGVDK